ncbi:MAG: hypothetical protein ACHQ4H_02455 [Ktedonobacterales bacterium]
MEKRLVKLLGNSAKHMLVGLRRAFYAVALTGLIVAVLAAAATEFVGYLLTKQFPPSGATHLAAAALAISFGYAAAITVAIGEILRAVIKAVELIVEEAERLEKKATEELAIFATKAGQEAVKVGREAVTDAGSAVRTVTGDAGAVARGAAGVVGGVVGGVGHEVHSVEQGAVAHMPGHHAAER